MHPSRYKNVAATRRVTRMGHRMRSVAHGGIEMVREKIIVNTCCEIWSTHTFVITRVPVVTSFQPGAGPTSSNFLCWCWYLPILKPDQHITQKKTSAYVRSRPKIGSTARLTMILIPLYGPLVIEEPGVQYPKCPLFLQQTLSYMPEFVQGDTELIISNTQTTLIPMALDDKIYNALCDSAGFVVVCTPFWM